MFEVSVAAVPFVSYATVRVSRRRPGPVLRQAAASNKARPRSAHSLGEVECFQTESGL